MLEEREKQCVASSHISEEATVSKNAKIHPSAYIDAGAEIGDNTKVWHFSHILEDTIIGANCSFGQNTSVGPRVRIGNGVKVQNNVSIYEGVEIEDEVFCGPSCVFTNDLTPRAAYPKGHENFVKTKICRGATIGANATIVCGHTLYPYATVAAGAVVTRDILAHELVYGVPARHQGWVCTCGQILEPQKIDGSVRWSCPDCDRQFCETEQGLEDIG